MKLYLDDDIVAARMIQTLRRAGHDVRTPAEVGLVGAPDPVHFRRALAEGRRVLSRNYDDFADLHHLILEAHGHHPGVLIVRRDDKKQHNMSPHDVARALRNLEAACVPIADEYINLNPWQ